MPKRTNATGNSDFFAKIVVQPPTVSRMIAAEPDSSAAALQRLSFSFSSSALESGVATFYKDENRDAQYNELAESKLDENENVVYFVNGEAADEDAFTAVINAQNEKADVTFVPATAENLALYLTIE